MTAACQARTGSDGQTRCAACRIVVDADDVWECRREAEARELRKRHWTPPAREPFVSALAPDPFKR